MFPVYQREVHSNMYDPTPYWFARTLTSMIQFCSVYPLTVTLSVIWFIGLSKISFVGFLQFWAILQLISMVGLILGLSVGAAFPNSIVALNYNTFMFIVFSFGSGLYANTATSSNFLVKLASWLSPLKYACESMLRFLLQDKDESF